jgi:two-component system chemotaxis response regulator CheY
MKTVLLIDDEEFMLTHFARLIKKMGFEVVATNNGPEGVELYKKIKPDGVFLDIMLPEMNGEQVFKAIKEIDADAKICFLSGSEHELKRLSALNLGASGYLSKPFLQEDIMKALYNF